MVDKEKELKLITALPDAIHGFMLRNGVPEAFAAWLDQIISMAIIILIAYLIGIAADRIGNRIMFRIMRLTKTEWDDIFYKNRVFHKAITTIPAMIIYSLVPLAIRSAVWISVFRKIAVIYIIVQIIRAISSATTSLTEIYSAKTHYSTKPIKVFFQIINVVSIFCGGIIILSVLINESVTTLIAGLGASMAIIMLIFKDSILGFVAGWQLSANDQLRIGDWITVPKYGADGDVIEMSLYAVKVRNFDNTITTVPPYALISESFQNWRGMQESGGRRIKRSINIDMKSVRFCDSEMLERFSSIGILREYIETKQKEIDEFNVKLPEKSPIYRRQTNLGVFRAYVTNYLKNNPELNTSLTYMVRQLQPTEKGIPLEIYCFVADKKWVHYESVQSDIFDHIISIIPFFGLEIFQYPSDNRTAVISN